MTRLDPEHRFAHRAAGGPVLFAHDHRFIPAGGVVWSEQQFGAATWDRYLRHFDGVTVAARCGAIPEDVSAETLERASAEGVGFELFPNLSSLKGTLARRRGARARMRGLVLDHTAVVARLPSEIGLLAIAAARETATPCAVEVVGCPYDGLRHYGTVAGRLYAPLAMRRMKRAVAQSDHAIYVTRSFLQGRYPTDARNIAGVSDVALADVSEAVLDARLASISARRDCPIRLGLVGTLRGRFKGIQTLFAALAGSQRRLPDWELHILGGGDPAPWREEAAAAGIGARVRFHGTLPTGARVFDWLDRIDLYLQPSLKEGLPRALVEAMSRGCPAIATRVAGIPELLPQADLVAPNDPRALGALLEDRMGDTVWMTHRARLNWSTARGYRADVLAHRRQAFWARFKATL